MSKAHDSREGLAALLADVLSDGAPDPTLLVRYADDPSDFSEARESSDRKSGSWLSDALDRVRRLFETRPVLAWAPAIAVAALVLLLIYPSAFSIFRLDRSSEPTSEPVPEQIADDPSAPSTVHQDRSSEPASEPVPEQIADERILEQTPATPTAHVPSSIVPCS